MFGTPRQFERNAPGPVEVRCIVFGMLWLILRSRAQALQNLRDRVGNQRRIVTSSRKRQVQCRSRVQALTMSAAKSSSRGQFERNAPNPMEVRRVVFGMLWLILGSRVQAPRNMCSALPNINVTVAFSAQSHM